VPTPDDDDALIERFVPIIRFTAGEYFLPMSIDTYLARCELRRQIAGRTEVLATSGQVDRNTLVQLAGTASGCSLAYVTEPATRTATAVWRLDDERPRFRAANRLGTVGVMSRLIDSALRFSLLVRGRVASGTEAAAELAYRPERVAADHWCYARLLRQDGYTVLQYWFFYAFNDWRSRASGVNDHEADWEQVTVFLTESADGAQPRWVAFSSHDYQGDDLRRRWDDPDLTKEGDRPVVFAGLGSHSGAYLAGDYLMIVDKGTLGRIFAVGRRLTRLLLPWTRGVERDGIGDGFLGRDRMRPARFAEAPVQHGGARLEEDERRRHIGRGAQPRVHGRERREETLLADVDHHRHAGQGFVRAMQRVQFGQQRHRQVVDAVVAEILDRVNRLRLAGAGEAGDDEEVGA
jgi:hypothetical protein